MTDRLEVYRSDNDGQWYWRRIDQGNHEKLAQGEGYTRRADALTGALRANTEVDG